MHTKPVVPSSRASMPKAPLIHAYSEQTSSYAPVGHNTYGLHRLVSLLMLLFPSIFDFF